MPWHKMYLSKLNYKRARFRIIEHGNQDFVSNVQLKPRIFNMWLVKREYSIVFAGRERAMTNFFILS